MSRERGGVEDEEDVRSRPKARSEAEETSGCLRRVSDESACSSVTSIEIDDIVIVVGIVDYCSRCVWRVVQIWAYMRRANASALLKLGASAGVAR